MAAYLNESEIESAIRFFDNRETAGLHLAARILDALAAYANANSDGWHMWKAPRKAAANLIDVLEDKRREYLRGHAVLDLTEAELTPLLKPVKAFLTRERVDYSAALPWAALFPAV